MSTRRKVGNLSIYLNVFRKELVLEDQEKIQEKRKREPDYRGKLDIQGVSYDTALWINQDANGLVVNMSGQITFMEE